MRRPGTHRPAKATFLYRLLKGAWRHLYIIVVAALSFLAVATSKADTQINLNGKVKAGTCVVNNPAVIWDEISAGDIKAHGRVATSAKVFELELNGCAGVASAKFTFGSTSDRDPGQTDTFRNTAANPAPNLTIWLQRANAVGACPGSGSTQAPGSTHTILITSADQTLPLCATYWNKGTDDVTAGDVNATITVGVAYN